jgi:hypothetical protein
MRTSWLCTFWLSLIVVPASAAEKVSLCLQAEIKLPTLEEHRTYLEHNPRYGSEWADEYFDAAKQYGNDFIQYQVHYQPAASGSLRNDIRSYNGFKAAPVESANCEPPVVLLIGLKPVSINGKALSVTESRGLYGLISLASSEEAKRVSQLKFAGSDKILCEEIRREMGFGVKGHPCVELARKFQDKR